MREHGARQTRGRRTPGGSGSRSPAPERAGPNPLWQRLSLSRTPPVIQRKPAEVTAYNFLGLAVGGGINATLQGRLTTVAAELHRRFHDVHDRAPTDDAELREWLGVTSIGGWREQRSNNSYHCSGSAVDVSYRNQPYIVTRTETPSGTVHGGEAGGAGLTAQRVSAAEVYDRAVRFVYGQDRADVSARRPAEDGNPREGTAAVYRRFRSVSDALGIYLGLAFIVRPDWVRRPPVADIDGATEAELLAAIPETERYPEAEGVQRVRDYILNHGAMDGGDETYHWNWEDSFLARDYYFQMLRDYEHVRIPMVVGNPEARPGVTRNPAYGFLQLSEDFVVAMADTGNLRWGISDLGAASSGDTHHFDLGNNAGVTRDCTA
jgi:hypothetical protein